MNPNMSALLVLDDLTKNFGGLRVTDHVSLDLSSATSTW